MAKIGRVHPVGGTQSQFGAPRKSEDLAMAHFSEKLFVELKHYRKTISVPHDYVSHTQMQRHPSKNSFGTLNYVDPLVLRAALTEPTDVLIAGAKYDVRFYAVGGKLSSEVGIKFLRENRSLQVGVPGLSLIYALLSSSFPFDRWVIALDDRGHLFADDHGSFRVPMILHPIASAASFSLGHFSHPWNSKHIIMTVMRIG